MSIETSRLKISIWKKLSSQNLANTSVTAELKSIEVRTKNKAIVEERRLLKNLKQILRILEI